MTRSRPAALLVPIALAALPLACRPRQPPPEPPLPEITTSTAAAFSLVRRGTDPAFEARDGTWVFFSPGAGPPLEAGRAAGDRRLPGLTLGDVRGPRFGLIGGRFAPHLLTGASEDDVRLSLTSGPLRLTARFDGTAGAGTTAVDVLPPRGGRIELVVRGAGTVFLAADQAQVRARLAGAPRQAFSITAGEPPSVVLLPADELEVDGERQGAITVRSSCPELRVIRPVPRGSTSVFAVGFGPPPARPDPLFGVEGSAPASACSPTTTSTLSFPAPGRP